MTLWLAGVPPGVMFYFIFNKGNDKKRFWFNGKYCTGGFLCC